MNSALRPEDALCLTGLSHYTAAVGLRERLAFRPEVLPRALGAIRGRRFLEAAILSTCNRVEVLAVARLDDAEAPQRIRAFLSEFHGVPEAEFAPALYELRGPRAAEHLFEVTASLDSQVLGETEILAQAKEAYRVAAEAGTCGRVLRRLFERSFFISKELRAEGGIGRAQASVSSAAVALANKLFDVRGRNVLVIGTGEMAAGIVRSLKGSGVGEVFVASRTEARAAEFAQREGGKPCPIQKLPEYLLLADIVLVSAAAPNYIIGPAQAQAAAAGRRGRALCLIDISVPRNVDPAAGDVEDVFRYDIDDLENVAKEGRREREQVAARWRPRLAEEAREVLRELEDCGAQYTAHRLLEHINAIRQDVLRQARTAGLDPKAVEELTRALERMQGRILHHPLETLKQAAREGDGPEATAWVSRLFRLETPVAGETAAAKENMGETPMLQTEPQPQGPETRNAGEQAAGTDGARP